MHRWAFALPPPQKIGLEITPRECGTSIMVNGTLAHSQEAAELAAKPWRPNLAAESCGRILGPNLAADLAADRSADWQVPMIQPTTNPPRDSRGNYKPRWRSG